LINIQGAATRWAVNHKPYGLSVSAAYNVLVAGLELGLV